jgi:hypothetical protein
VPSFPTAPPSALVPIASQPDRSRNFGARR